MVASVRPSGEVRAPTGHALRVLFASIIKSLFLFGRFLAIAGCAVVNLDKRTMHAVPDDARAATPGNASRPTGVGVLVLDDRGRPIEDDAVGDGGGARRIAGVVRGRAEASDEMVPPYR